MTEPTRREFLAAGLAAAASTWQAFGQSREFARLTVKEASSYYGLPAISVPCGFNASGLPIGLQIGGGPFMESAVLAIAHAYEQATQWHVQRPNLPTGSN